MLFFFVLAVIALAILSTLARFAVHSAKGFSIFQYASSDWARMARLLGDIFTIVALPTLFVFISSEGGGISKAYGFLLSDWKAFYWLGLIVLCVIGYFLAVYLRQLFPPWQELILGVLAGTGIVINLIIAWPMFEENGAIILALLGNLPIILLFILVFTRRHALLLEHAQESVHQRRFSAEDIIDYMPDYEAGEVYRFAGISGQILRQPLPLKIAFGIGVGALIVCLSYFTLDFV